MENMIRLLLKRRLIIYLSTLLIVIAGLGSLYSFNIELLPKTNLPQISVKISGTALPPEEMEEKVTNKIEQELRTVAGITDFTSRTGTGFTQIMITAEGSQGEKVKQEIQTIVNRLRNGFPQGIDQVDITQLNLGDEQLIDFALVGADPQALLHIAHTTIRNKIKAVPGVKAVEVMERSIANEISITLDPDRIAVYGMTISGVMDQLKMMNWKQAVGTIENTGFDTVVMVDGSIKNVHQLSSMLISTPRGAVPLHTLATIEDQRGKVSDSVGMTNGQVLVQISVTRGAGTDLIETQRQVEQAVKEVVDASNGQYEAKVMFEGGSFIKNAVGNLSRDVLIGGLLAVLILLVFLRNLQVTLVIATTLPLSAFMTFIAMKTAGYHIDLVTLVSLSLCVGLVVDAAIVMLESIYQFREKGESLHNAIVKGSKEVFTPILTSQLTLIVVFLPLLFADFEEWLKPILHTIAFTVTSTIVASTIAAYFFVPVFAQRFLKHDKNSAHLIGAGGKQLVVVGWFYRLLQLAIRNRVKTVLLAVLIFVGVMMLAPFIKMGENLNPYENLMQAEIRMPSGFTVEMTKQAGLEAERSLRQIADVKDVFFFASEEMAQFYISLVGKKQRQHSKEELTKEINERLSHVTYVERVSTVFGGSGEEAPIQINIIGEDMETSRSIAGDIEKLLATVPGVVNIRNDFDQGKEKLTLIPDQEEMLRLGVDQQSLLSQLSMILGKQVVTKMTMNGMEVDVVAKLPEAWMKHPDQLRAIMITTATGEQVRLSELGEIQYGKSPVVLKHEKGDRLLTVSAELLGTDLGSSGRAIKEKLSTLPAVPGHKVEIAGKLKEQTANMTQGLFVFLAVVAIIYVILVAQFGRLSHPFIILLTIPMALVGVVIGFLLTRRTLGEMAMIGVIMLVGIVVSNAILLIDRINLLRSRGYQLNEAILQGTKDRVRPVLMTKLTAILGMLPLALGLSEGSDLQTPLATAVIGGLISHTMVTLVLVPVLYSLFESRRERRMQKRNEKWQTISTR